MRRLRHGEMLTLETDSQDVTKYRATLKTRPFGYMFADLQRDDRNLLETSSRTVESLRQLGAAMEDPGEVVPGIPVPAIHTFFGQFVDHDITLELGSASIHLDDPNVLTLEQVAEQIVNSRSPDLDLDNVYGPDINGMLSPRDPVNPEKMLLGKVCAGRGLPPGKDIWNDFPRDPDSGAPRVGDSRDDENIITNQLHVAFLRAHNAVVDRGYRFDEARKLLTQHYQWIVLDDFLERICDPNIVRLIRLKGPRFFNPPPRSFFMPLEFSVAAYRFGHSKVRPAYDDFNIRHVSSTLDLLFRFAGECLPDDWVIDWPSFLDPEDPERFPRPIDTSLTYVLLHLNAPQLGGHDPESNLAIRNLLRGYILRLPTGQAVAKAMAAQGIVPLTPKQITLVAQEISDAQYKVLEGTGFLTRTPLWFYILAEAAFYSRGHHLGPVGSTIVAEVLIGVLRNSTDSILSDPQCRPTLGTRGKFDFEDLLKLAGVF
jgi:Animal haem peroxidase